MNFVEAIDAMKNGKICFREQNQEVLFRIKDKRIYSKEKGYEWSPENVLELQDFDTTDWKVLSKEYVKTTSVGDILLDDEEDMLMVIIDADGDYYMAINENGCIETIDLDANCYERLGDYPLIKNVITQLNEVRKNIKK